MYAKGGLALLALLHVATSASATLCVAGTYSASPSASCSPCDAGKFSAANSSSCTACAAGFYSGARDIFHLISANDQTRALSFGGQREINDEYSMYYASLGLGSLAHAAAFKFDGTYVSYLDDMYLGLHCNCGVYEEGNSCILIRSRSAPKSEGGQSLPEGRNGDGWIRNDDGTFSPISDPLLVLGYGTVTRKCPGEQNSPSEDMGLFSKGSRYRVVAQPYGGAPGTDSKMVAGVCGSYHLSPPDVGNWSRAPSCFQCMKGTYSAESSPFCTSCEIGHYSSSSAASSCTPCGVGKFSVVPGSSSCTACAAGFYSGASDIFHLISANDQTRALSFGGQREINDEYSMLSAGVLYVVCTRCTDAAVPAVASFSFTSFSSSAPSR
jgi:hypothetical protein